MTRKEYWNLPWYKRLTTEEPLPEQPEPIILRVHMTDGDVKDVKLHAYWWSIPYGYAKHGSWQFDIGRRGREIATEGFWHDGFFYPATQVKMVENLNRRS